MHCARAANKEKKWKLQKEIAKAKLKAKEDIPKHTSYQGLVKFFTPEYDI